jgi:hypothetical protein
VAGLDERSGLNLPSAGRTRPKPEPAAKSQPGYEGLVFFPSAPWAIVAGVFLAMIVGCLSLVKG